MTKFFVRSQTIIKYLIIIFIVGLALILAFALLDPANSISIEKLKMEHRSPESYLLNYEVRNKGNKIMILELNSEIVQKRRISRKKWVDEVLGSSFLEVEVNANDRKAVSTIVSLRPGLLISSDPIVPRVMIRKSYFVDR